MRRNRLFGNKLHLYAKRPLNCGIRTREQDRVYRLAYRLGYPIAKRWWRLHGRNRGVSIAVWLGDTVLTQPVPGGDLA